MKRVFNITSLVIVFLYAVLLINPSKNNNFSDKLYENQQDVSICGDSFVDVSTADEFISAGNANDNMCIVNDIDFSTISSGEKIGTYSGIIEGNGYTLSNHNYDQNNPKYLFDTFIGDFRNVAFDNFPFLIKNIGELGNEKVTNFNNINYTNIDLGNINFFNEAKDAEVNLGIFSSKIENANFKNFNIENISFENEVISIYSDSLDLDLNLGVLAGKIESSSFTKLTISNINIISNHIVDCYTDDDEENISESTTKLNLGLVSGLGQNITVKDSYINSIDIETNLFKSKTINSGLIFGSLSSTNSINTIQRMYFSNIDSNQNQFYYENKYNVGYLVGYSDFDSNDSINFDSIVVREYNTNSYQLFNFDNEYQNISEITNIIGLDENTNSTVYSDVYLDTFNSNYKIDQNIEYVEENKLTTDWWIQNTSFENSSSWNVNSLLDENLVDSTNLNSDDEIYGYPSVIYKEPNKTSIKTTIDTSENNTYVIDVTYSSTVEDYSFSINSIFGDSYVVNESGDFSFDTEISTEVPFSYVSSYYWLESTTIDSSTENLTIVGDITSTDKLDLYEEDPEIINSFDISVILNRLVYRHDVLYSGPENIILDNNFDSSITVGDIDGNSVVLDEDDNIINLPIEIINSNNINYYYHVEFNESNNISYLSSDKTIKEIEPTLTGDLTNEDDSLDTIIPTVNLNTSFLEGENSNSIKFEIQIDDKQNRIIYNSINSDDLLLIFNSSFIEFEETSTSTKYSQAVYVNDFIKVDDYTYDYEISLSSDIDKEDINSYYQIQTNFKFEYYSNLSGDTSSIYLINSIEGDLTNTSIINQYNSNEPLNSWIDTSYDASENVLTVLFGGGYFNDYDLNYNFDLILKSSTNSYEFNLNSDNKKSEEIKLQDNTPELLSEGYTLNEIYSLNIQDNDNSYVEYLNENGRLEKIKFDNIVPISLDSNSRSLKNTNDIKLLGDLTNTDDSNLVEPQTISEDTYKWLWIMAAFFIVILIVSLTIATINSNDKIR